MADYDYITDLSPQQIANSDKLASLVGGSLGSGYYLPDYLTGHTELQEGAYGHAQDIVDAGGIDPEGIRAEAIADLTTGKVPYQYDAAGSSRAFDEAVYDPALRRFGTDTLPKVANYFAGGTGSGDYQRAMARAASDFGADMGAQRAGWTWEDYRGYKDDLMRANELRATGLDAGYNEAMIPIDVGLGVGGVQRDIENDLAAQSANQYIAQNYWWANPAMDFYGAAQTPTHRAVAKPEEEDTNWGQVIGSVAGAALGTIVAPGIGTALGASLGGGIGGAI